MACTIREACRSVMIKESINHLTNPGSVRNAISAGRTSLRAAKIPIVAHEREG